MSDAVAPSCDQDVAPSYDQDVAQGLRVQIANEAWHVERSTEVQIMHASSAMHGLFSVRCSFFVGNYYCRLCAASSDWVVSCF